MQPAKSRRKTPNSSQPSGRSSWRAQGSSDDRVHRERREEQREIEERVVEEEHRAARRRVAPKLLGQPDEDGAEREGADDVERAGSSPGPRQEDRPHEGERVEDDLTRRR